MLVPNEGRMYSGTRCMVNAKVVHLGVSAEKVAFLLVDHELLNQLVAL